MIVERRKPEFWESFPEPPHPPGMGLTAHGHYGNCGVEADGFTCTRAWCEFAGAQKHVGWHCDGTVDPPAIWPA